MAVQMLLLGFQNWLLRICTCLISLFDQDSLSCLKNQNHHLSLTDQYIGSTERVARLYRVYLLHLLCSGNTVPRTEFRELHFLLVVPWKVFPEQIIVEVLGPQRAYRPEISRQGCLQGCGCGGRRQYYCFRFTMNHVIHPIETPPRLLPGRGGGVLSQGPYSQARGLGPGPG